MNLAAENRGRAERIEFVIHAGKGEIVLNDSFIAPERVPASAPSQPKELGVPSNLKPGADAGIYEDGQLLEDDDFRIAAGENILPAVRRALDAGHLEILVALDPGERYFLKPQEGVGQPRINDIYLNGADLVIAAIQEVDADGSGGRADLVLQRSQNGSYKYPFYLNASGYGNLDLENVALSAEARRPGEVVGFVTHYGDGDVRLVNSTVEAPSLRFRGDDGVEVTRPALGDDAAKPIEPARPERPVPTPGVAAKGSGIFLNGELLSGYELRPGTNILPVVRAAMDRISNKLEVRLDPGETYGFSPTGTGSNLQIANLYLGSGADMTFTAAASADANESGGFATLEVGPTQGGEWSNVFYQAHSATGSLTLDGISMTMPDRTPGIGRDFIVWRGGGSVNIIDSKLSGTATTSTSPARVARTARAPTCGSNARSSPIPTTPTGTASSSPAGPVAPRMGCTPATTTPSSSRTASSTTTVGATTLS